MLGQAGLYLCKHRTLWGCRLQVQVHGMKRKGFIMRRAMCATHGNDQVWCIEHAALLPCESTTCTERCLWPPCCASSACAVSFACVCLVMCVCVCVCVCAFLGLSWHVTCLPRPRDPVALDCLLVRLPQSGHRCQPWRWVCHQ